MADEDPHALLAVTQNYEPIPHQLPYALHFSPAGGRTWEPRHTDHVNSYGALVRVSAQFLPGPGAPVTTMAMQISNGVPGSNGGDTVYLSVDGGRSFQSVG